MDAIVAGTDLLRNSSLSITVLVSDEGPWPTSSLFVETRSMTWIPFATFKSSCRGD